MKFMKPLLVNLLCFSLVLPASVYGQTGQSIADQEDLSRQSQKATDSLNKAGFRIFSDGDVNDILGVIKKSVLNNEPVRFLVPGESGRSLIMVATRKPINNAIGKVRVVFLDAGSNKEITGRIISYDTNSSLDNNKALIGFLVKEMVIKDLMPLGYVLTANRDSLLHKIFNIFIPAANASHDCSGDQIDGFVNIIAGLAITVIAGGAFITLMLEKNQPLWGKILSGVFAALGVYMVASPCNN